MDFTRYLVNNIFSEKVAAGAYQNLTVSTLAFQATAATDNQLAVAATTGKRIKVLHYNLCSDGAEGLIMFRSNSGGTVIWHSGVALFTAIPANPNTNPGPNPWGWFETSTGHGLYVNNTGAAAVRVAVGYVIYTP